MKLRKTESRIPGGFTLANAEKLGYAVMHEDNKHCLVSFFPKDIRLQKPNKDFKNCYVLFTKEDPGTAVSYIWEVEFIYPAGSGKSNLILEVSGLANPSVYCLEASNYLYGRDVPSSLQKIKVTCIIPSDGGTKRVSLIHETKTVDDDILEIIHGEGHSNAIGGNPKTTQLVANFYRGFFHVEPSWEDAVVAVPVNISMGILYQQMMKFNSQNLINELYELKINEDDFDYSAIETQKHKIGLCAIKPHLAALSLDKLNYGRLGSGAGDKTEEDVFNEFIDLDDEDAATYNKYDIFNFSRFPKSSVLLSTYMLHKLLIRAKEEGFSNYEGEPSSWSTIKKDEIKHDEELIKYLLTEYGIGPQKSISSFSLNGFSRAMNHDWSSYILKIIEERPVDYEVVRVKVLDIRSGKPVKNAKVKRIIIDAGGGTRIGGNKYKVNDEGISVFENAEHAFSYDPPSYDNDDTVIKKAQIALNELGFDHGSAGSTFGDKGTTQFNKYWEIQSQGNIVKQFSKDELNDENNESAIHLLNAIVYEYESHRQTDRSGILRVQIPKPYLQNPTAPSVESPSVFIEVGFWEFPIALEQLHNPSYHNDFQHSSASPIIRRNQMESATGFQVSWMEDENLQETDWMATVEATEEENHRHFGWKVSHRRADNGVEVEETQSYLKVAERIKIKKAGEEFESDSQLFSKFYELKLKEYHFVLFGMEWSQPITDNIPDELPTGVRSSEEIFLNRKRNDDATWIKQLKMHIVSKSYGGKNLNRENEPNSFGQYYGFYDRNPINHKYRENKNDLHDGVDIYSGPNSEGLCFAVHGGILKLYNSDTMGKTALIGIQYSFSQNQTVFNDDLHALYGHLSKYSSEYKNKVVLAGQVIGTTGRTGEAFRSSNEPSHLHFQMGRGQAWSNSNSHEPFTYLKNKDIHNAYCLPGNSLPLMLPCKCVFGENASRNPSGCGAGNKKIAHSCWALIKYPTYDYRSTRSHGNVEVYHEFPDQIQRINGLLSFVCPYIHKNIQAKLNEGISMQNPNSIISIQLTNSSEFPPNGAVLVNNEIIEYTGNDREKNLLTGCKRKKLNTSIANHSAGDAVTYLNYEAYYVKACLRFIYENRGVNGIPGLDFSPGEIREKVDEVPKYGSIPDLISVDFKKGDEVEILQEDGILRQMLLKKGDKEGWVEKSDGILDFQTRKLKYDLPKLLSSKVEARDRLSIYFFRKVENSLSLDYSNYSSNFRVDRDLLVKLRYYLVNNPI